MATRTAVPSDILNIEVEIDEQFNNYSFRYPNGSFLQVSAKQAAQLMVAQEQLKQLQEHK